MRNVSKDKVAKIKKAYEQGKSFSVIKKECGCSFDTIVKYSKLQDWQRPESYFENSNVRRMYAVNKRKNFAAKTPNDLDNTQIEIAKELYEQQHKSIEEISEITGIKRVHLWNIAGQKAKNWVRKAKAFFSEPEQVFNQPVMQHNQQNTQVGQQTKYNSDVELFKTWIGELENPFKPRILPHNNGNQKAWMIISDLHVPYHDLQKLKKGIELFKATYGHIPFHGLVINGDLLDGYRLNSYEQDDRTETFRDELASGRALLQFLQTQFNDVVLVDDNHIDGRFGKFKRLIDPQFHCILQHPYDVITDGLTNVRRSKHTYANGEELSWFTVVGDAFICHAETYGLRAISNIHAWVDSWSDELGLPKIRVIAEGHTHKGTEEFIPGRDRKAVQTGCFVTPKGVKYGMKADIKHKPVVNGFVMMLQENDVTDLNSVRFIKL